MSEPNNNETPGVDRPSCMHPKHDICSNCAPPDLNESATAGIGGDVADGMAYASARIGIEVTAGLIPGKPDAEFTKKWFITSDVWRRMNEGDPDARAHFIRVAGESREYAATLEDPRRLNWVRRDWVYF